RRRPAAVREGETGPLCRNARIDAQTVASFFEPENSFKGCAITPTRRARVPGPATTAFVTGNRVHVASDRVWFDHVPRHAFGVDRPSERVEHSHKRARACSLAKLGRC